MIQFGDGFDHYLSADIFEGWTTDYGGSNTSSATIQPGLGRRGTAALRFQSPASAVDPRALAAAVTPNRPVSWGQWALQFSGSGGFGNMNNAGSEGQSFSLMINGNGQARKSWLWQLRYDSIPHVGLAVQQNGTLRLWRNEGSGVGVDVDAPTLLGTTPFALQWNQWFFLEYHLVLDAVAGSFRLTINGIEWLNLTNINTLGKYDDGSNLDPLFDQFIIGGISGNQTTVVNLDIDDLLIGDDDAGTDSLNHYVTTIGDAELHYRRPTQDGTYREFTSLGGGANYLEVDDVAPDNDASYNFSPTIGARDTFGLEDAPITGVGVLAVMVVNSIRRLSGSTLSTPMVRSAGTDSQKSDLGDTASYSYHYGFWTRDPATGVPFTEAGFNALEVGYRKTG